MYARYCSLHVPVYASDFDVIRAARNQFTPEARDATDHATRLKRHNLYRALLREHHAAQDLCRQFRI